MSRAIIVLAPPRTGSSAVAGALQRLGVNMGDDPQPADVLNKKGYYEDRMWQRINKEVAGHGYTVHEPDEVSDEVLNAYRQVIAHYDERYDVWGFKNPRACFTLQFVWPLLDEAGLSAEAQAGVDVRVIDWHRDYDDAVKSLQRHSQIAYGGQKQMTAEEARTLQKRWHQAARARRDEAEARGYPILHMYYEHLMREPYKRLGDLAEFCLGDVPAQERLQMAAGFLSPKLRTYA